MRDSHDGLKLVKEEEEKVGRRSKWGGGKSKEGKTAETASICTMQWWRMLSGGVV